jgi:hypothetical protein
VCDLWSRSLKTMDRPTTTELRTWSPPAFVWADYGFPDPAGDAALDVRIGWAVGTLYAVTGRKLDTITSDEEIPIAQKVIAMLAIMEALGGGKAALAVMEKPWLKSFAAGSYREDRFSPAELAGVSGTTKQPPYPAALWTLLWALMTPEKRDEWTWLLTGQAAPATTFIDPGFGGDCGDSLGGLVFGSGVTHGWPFAGW